MYSKLFSAIWLCAVALLVAGCSGGDGTSEGTEGPVGGWVTITDPSDTGQATTYCNEVLLQGEAFISSDYYHCCSGEASDTGVSVRWENLVSGDFGSANQDVQYCYLFGTPVICGHTWRATVPLLLGDNMIRVTAIDPGGTGGVDMITVIKPDYSYTASGLISSYDGFGLGYYQIRVELLLTGDKETNVVPSSAEGVAGEYRFSCLPNGVYSVTPSTAAFNYGFEPGVHTFTVAGQDVTQLDFMTRAYPLSGTLTNSAGVPISLFRAVEMSNGSESVLVGNIAEDGTYSFFVPAGSYTLTPVDLLCDTCSFLPAQRTVNVIDAGMAGLDFSQQN